MASLLLRRCFRRWPQHQLFRKISLKVSKSESETFSRAKCGNFFQDSPAITNTFLSDNFLQRCLMHLLPEEVYGEVYSDLSSFGSRVCSEIDLLGRMAEVDPPMLRNFDPWGKRVDEIITSPAWKDLHSISASEGLVALAYERKYKQWSRLHQMAKLYLFAPSSGLYTCPLAMTDGAAKLVELSGDDYLKNQVLSHLITRDPKYFWTSGQWMTEKKGGSDVGGGTSSVAKSLPACDNYLLYGYKWFSSAIDAQVAFTLARIVDEKDSIIEGTHGLSLFYLETKNKAGNINGLEIQRLKNKLGTKQLPTAEVLLDGTLAYLVGKPGRGVANISPMLNITRLHNSVCAVGNMRRMMHLCGDYANKRIVFGKCLSKHPLHMHTLARMEAPFWENRFGNALIGKGLQTRGCTLFVLEVCRILGKVENGVSTTQEKLLLRILTPLAKLFTAKQAIAVASEGLEAIGGQGYIEDTGLPTLLRDAQVLSIWEGTTNVLSLDVIKILLKNNFEVMSAITHVIKSYLRSADNDLKEQADTLNQHLDSVTSFIQSAISNDPSILHTAARDFSFRLSQIYIGSLLINHASSECASTCDKNAAIRWCHKPNIPLDIKYYLDEEVKKNHNFVLNDK